MGTDRDDLTRPCPCGQGSIKVVQESPDHPWARADQTSYTGFLKCDECAEQYAIADNFGGRPFLALKIELEAKDTAKGEYWALDKAFRVHALAKSIEPTLVAEIEAATSKSKVAAHRVLQKHRLTSESIATYRKSPRPAETYVEGASGYRMAAIGETLAATEQERAAFGKVRQQLDDLRAAETKKLEPVVTGHPWLEA
jgi:hypothetical protein